MNEPRKTLIFVVGALMLAGAAAVRLTRNSTAEPVFNDQGRLFFPDFTDPSVANSLEVYEFDPTTSTAVPFEVALKDGKWVIPSHNNYPADAKDRLKNTASGVMDLKKESIRSTLASDHQDLGVLDPLDPKLRGSEGVGKRVKLRQIDNNTQKVLADFIIGKEVPGHPEQHYVRDPEQKPTYAVNVKVDLSTRFSDWIETNLLKVEASKIRQLVFDNHKVDPEQRTIVPGDVVTAARADATAPWTLDPPPGPGDEVNTDKLTSLTTSLADLKIAGVRPMPSGVGKVLATLKKGGRMTQSMESSIESLYLKGFYATQNGLVSNQGDVRVATDEGVVYTLRFGEITFATGEELSAGKKDEKESAKDKKDPRASEEKKVGRVESRYLLVTVDFDPKLIPDPTPPPVPAPTALPDEVFQPEPGSAGAKAMAEADTKRAETIAAERDRQIDAGKKRVKELSDRFLSWYYVVPGDNFRSIVVNRAALVRKKGEKPPTPEGPPPGFPGMDLPGGFPGLPPGHP